jgi:hypothetical protein
MTLAFSSPSGIVNLMPSGFRTQSQIETDKRRAMSAVTKPTRQYGPGTGALAGLTEFAQRARIPSGAPRSERELLQQEQAYRRQQRPTTYQDIAAQLPVDTPPRYDGYTSRPPTPVVSRTTPPRALPALIQPTPSRGVIPPPVLRPSVATTTAANTRRVGSTVTPPPIKKAPPPPPARKPSGSSVTTVKAPTPPPVKTPTTTAGVYRPPSVTTSGPLR